MRPRPASPPVPATAPNSMSDDAADFPFTPVPSASLRHDGWTPERQRDFIAQLARIGMVSAAARAVGMSAKSAYALRKRTGAASFAAAWDRALDAGRALVLDLAIERALHGTPRPILYRGRHVGVRRMFAHRLLIAALRTMPRDDAGGPTLDEALAALRDADDPGDVA